MLGHADEQELLGVTSTTCTCTVARTCGIVLLQLARFTGPGERCSVVAVICSLPLAVSSHILSV
jgi:hypothetical protein